MCIESGFGMEERMGRDTQPGKPRFCGLIPFVFGVVRTKGQFHPQALKAGKVGFWPSSNTFTLGYFG